MSEQDSDHPKVKFKYNVDLGDNRGKTVMKFTEEEAEKRGLTNEDKVDGQEIVADDFDRDPEPEPEEADETLVTSTKAKGAANKRKPASDK